MAEKEIESGNVLIAEFMGYKYFPPEASFPDGYYDMNQTSLPMQPEDFCYNESWNWIMPVVEKIKSDQHNPNEMFMGTTLERKAYYEGVTMIPISTPIKTVWERIVSFVTWYNKQKS